MIKLYAAFIFLLIHSDSSKNILTGVSFATFTDTFQSHQINGCDGDVLVLDCPFHYEIDIQNINFRGLSSNTTDCTDEFEKEEVDVSACDIEEKEYSIKETCEGEESCSILVAQVMIGDSLHDLCPEVRELIQVEYICLPSDVQSAFILPQKENFELHNLKCENNARLAIFSSILTNNVPGNTVDCSEEDITHIVSRICHGQEACTVFEEAMIFDKECNFLDIRYACMDSGYFNYEFLRYIEEDSDIAKDNLYNKSNVNSENMGNEGKNKNTKNKKKQKGNKEKANYTLSAFNNYDSRDNDSMEAEIDVIDDDILEFDTFETHPNVFNITKKKSIEERKSINANYDGSFYLNVSAKSFSAITNDTSILELTPLQNHVLNFILAIVAGVSDVITVLKENPVSLVLVVIFSVLTPLLCFLIFFTIRIYSLYKDRVDSDEESYI